MSSGRASDGVIPPGEPIRVPSYRAAPRTESACRTGTPGSLWMTPIDPLQKVAELRGRDRHGAVGRGRPEEAAPFEALGVKRQAEAVVPEHFDEIAATAAEDIEVAGVRIATEGLLDLEREAIHAAAHVGMACRQPDPHAGGDGNHRRSSTSSTRARAAESTPASTMTCRPPGSTIAIRPTGPVRPAFRSSGRTTAGTKPSAELLAVVCLAPHALRHANSNEGE